MTVRNEQFRCEFCRDKSNRCFACQKARGELRRARRAAKRARGECEECRESALPNRTRCAHHLERHAVYAARTRAQ
jgi:hypothetical protein